MKSKHVAGLFAVLAAAFILQSCASAPMSPMRDGVKTKKADYGSPEDSVLVYGSAVDVWRTGDLSNMEMVQLNPSQKPAIITPAYGGWIFYTEPLPVGSSLRVFGFSIERFQGDLDVTTFYERGVQGSGPIDRKLTKPGLLYLGSFVYCDKSYAEEKSGTKFGSSYDSTDFYPIGEDRELTILKVMLHSFKGTSWEPIITARIQELKK